VVSLFDSRIFCTRPRGLSPSDIPSVITRRELAERFGASAQLGISVSFRSPDVFLICVAWPEKRSDFDDGWKEDGCFHYGGMRLTAGQELRAGNRTIAEAAQNGRSLHLFHGPRGAYEYQGKFELDPALPYYWTYPLGACRTPQQDVIVFRLRLLERPAEPAPDHKPRLRTWSSQRPKHYVRPEWSVPISLQKLPLPLAPVVSIAF
jgi:hypothetical protein